MAAKDFPTAGASAFSRMKNHHIGQAELEVSRQKAGG
jgi:hypothetical protein